MAAIRIALAGRAISSLGPNCNRNLPQLCSLSRPFCISPQRFYAAAEKVTHTGQVYDDADVRKVRFVDRQKEVNENFAIDLVDEEPPIVVAGSSVYCDGGGGPLGHPKVYINLDKPGIHTCPYCGARYTSKFFM